MHPLIYTFMLSRCTRHWKYFLLANKYSRNIDLSSIIEDKGKSHICIRPFSFPLKFNDNNIFQTTYKWKIMKLVDEYLHIGLPFYFRQRIDWIFIGTIQNNANFIIHWVINFFLSTFLIRIGTSDQSSLNLHVFTNILV